MCTGVWLESPGGEGERRDKGKMRRGRETERCNVSLKGCRTCLALSTPFMVLCRERVFGTYPSFVVSVDSPMKRKLGELSALAIKETGGRVEGSLRSPQSYSFLSTKEVVDSRTVQWFTKRAARSSSLSGAKVWLAVSLLPCLKGT